MSHKIFNCIRLTQSGKSELYEEDEAVFRPLNSSPVAALPGVWMGGGVDTLLSAAILCGEMTQVPMNPVLVHQLHFSETARYGVPVSDVSHQFPG